jgi:hypothetical protein
MNIIKTALGWQCTIAAMTRDIEQPASPACLSSGHPRLGCTGAQHLTPPWLSRRPTARGVRRCALRYDTDRPTPLSESNSSSLRQSQCDSG